MSLAVVTGASGHVGASLVRLLVERGQSVRTVSREPDPESLRGLDVERVIADVTDEASLEAAFRGGDVVYHLAAQISIMGGHNGLVRAVNVGGVRTATEVALRVGTRRFVHMCSVHAMEHLEPGGTIDEDQPRVPEDCPRAFEYDRSKADGERIVRAAVARGLDAVILHPSGVIGPHDFGPSRMGRFFLDLAHRRLPGLVNGGYDFVDARDVALATVAAAERGRTGESYLLTGGYHSVEALAQAAHEVSGHPPPRFVFPIWLARTGTPFTELYGKLTGKEPIFTRESLHIVGMNPTFSRDKASRELGHEPRPIRESIADLYECFARRGLLPQT